MILAFNLNAAMKRWCLRNPGSEEDEGDPIWPDWATGRVVKHARG